MIIGRYLLLEPKVDLCFSNYTIRGNGGVYEGFTVSMKDPSNLRDYTIFRNEELWESEHVLESMWRTRSILDAQYQNADLRIIVSHSKHLNNNKRSMLYNVLTKYEFLFDGTLGTWKTKPVTELYHAKP